MWMVPDWPRAGGARLLMACDEGATALAVARAQKRYTNEALATQTL